MTEITPTELKKKLDAKEKLYIIDVREAYEYEICHIGGELIPMGEILSSTDRIPGDIPVIIHCRTGKRAAAVVDTLERLHGFTNLYNLKGGIIAYAEEVDDTLVKY